MLNVSIRSRAVQLTGLWLKLISFVSLQACFTHYGDHQEVDLNKITKHFKILNKRTKKI